MFSKVQFFLLSEKSQNKFGVVIYINAKQTVVTPQYALYGED